MQKQSFFNRRNMVRVLMILYDAFAVNFAYFMAMAIRYFFEYNFLSSAERLIPIFWSFVPYYAVISVVIFGLFRLYNTMWEFADINDLNRILIASIIVSIIHVAGTWFFFGPMTRSYYILGAFFQVVFIAASRFIYKIYLMERNQSQVFRPGLNNTMVIGVIGVGHFARRLVLQSNDKKLVCVLDPNSDSKNEYISNVPLIGGLSNFENALEKKRVQHVIIADEKLTQEQVKWIKEICDREKIEAQDFVEYLEYNNDSQIPVELKTNDEKARVIPFSPPDISDKEIKEVKKALQSGWITTGPRTKELERRLAEFCHTSKVVCLNSATAAEELNFRICGIGEGDEVIVPAYTYTASASAAIHCGAKVIFVDSQPDSTEMDYDKVAAAITERTKAIVAVDLGGIIADYDKLFEVVEGKRELFRAKEGTDLGARIQQAFGRVIVFADCAHALGATWHGRKAGEIADFTDFSFHAVKNFTTAEGGASTWRDIPGIDNEEMYKQYQLFSLHGQSKDALAKTKLGAWEYDIIGPWYKCNMTDIMAAIGLRQLDRYEGLVNRRHEIIQKYDAMCDELGVKHLVHEGDDFRSSGHLYLTRIPGITEEQRQEIIVKLAEMGVSTNVHYKPLPMMTAYKNYGWDIKDFPNAYDYYHNLITLPLHTKLDDMDVDYIISCYSKVVREYMK